MRTLQTEILVIGGGATGTGVLRDVAMRGFRTILVEARDLSHGTTGRFHGLLHSGGRYAVKDIEAAQDCIRENRILREIMPHCIEDTGGFFVLTPWDDPGFADSFVAGCHQAGIPVEELSIAEMLEEEPLLNPAISRCFRVPDGSADSFAASHANVASAREHGAKVLTYHEVKRLMKKEESGQKKVAGALCYDLVKDDSVVIYADLVVNAAGPWCGKIGATAGLTITMRPGKGTMIAVGQRIVNTVINRCRVPSDGDILVPAHTVSIMGTTDEQVPDPDDFGIEPWEVRLMLEEGEKIIPGFKQMRMLRAWAGVRPLYEEHLSGEGDKSREITRSFTLLDHDERDGVPGLITITGGKWTTYRQMAEETVDLVCEKLDTERACRTHLEVLPGAEKTGYKHTYLGHPLAHVEDEKAYGDLICECEMVTRAELEESIRSGDIFTLDDVRRDVRIGMGPCQGCFCTLRAAGMIHAAKTEKPVSLEDSNVALRDFLEERWKGVLPILWGKQLQQERLNELIYVNVLNLNALPGPDSSRLAAQPYTALTPSPRPVGHPPSPLPGGEGKGGWGGRGEGVLVIGAGLAGLAAGWQAASRGLRTRVIAQGWGSTHWGSGCIDVLHAETGSGESIIADLEILIDEEPEHPYALVGMKGLENALTSLQKLCQKAMYPLHGSLETTWLLPTVLGAARPTCLAPETMIGGDLRTEIPMLLVGFDRYDDFWPQMTAANLQAQGIEAQAVIIDPPMLRDYRRVETMRLAYLFDRADFRAQVVEALRPHLSRNVRVGFPAVLGLEHALAAKQDLEARLGVTVFEMPGLPPSVPGKRLHTLLVDAIRKEGGRVDNGMKVTTFSKDGSDRVAAVWTEATVRPHQHPAESFILATGGVLGEGITSNPEGHIFETIFNLPISNLPDSVWAKEQFLATEGQPIFRAGIGVNRGFAPTDEEGNPIYKNLFVIGNLLSGDFVRQRALEGVALASGFVVGKGVQ